MELLDILSEFSFDRIIFLIAAVFMVVMKIIEVRSYRKATSTKLSDNQEIIKELYEMKFRLPDYREYEVKQALENDEPIPGAQSFERVVPEFGLDKHGELVEVGQRDLVEEAQANKDVALNAMLEKFGAPLPGRAPTAPVVAVSDEPIADDLVDDLEDMNNAFAFFDDVRQRYHLPESMDYAQMLDFLQRQKASADEYIKSNIKKEEKSNEKTSVEQKGE